VAQPSHPFLLTRATFINLFLNLASNMKSCWTQSSLSMSKVTHDNMLHF